MNYKNKKYLVTGGTGFIGSALVHRLIKDGAKVRVCDNNSRGNFGRLEDIKNEIEFIDCDIRDYYRFEETVKDIDSIVHLAYVNGTEHFYSRPELVLDIAVKGITNVIDAAKQHKTKELIIASSSEVYQTPPRLPTPENVPLVVPDVFNPRYSYGGGKIITELMAVNNARYFERMMIFRPHNVYGPDMGHEHVVPQLIEKALKNKDYFEIRGDGSDTRAFCYIDDFIDGLITVLDKGHHKEIYNIGTEEEVSIYRLAWLVARHFGIGQIHFGENVKGGTNRRCPDMTKLKKLDFQPKIPLTNGVERVIRSYVQKTD